MELVHNNPYRIIGVWAGESERNILRQKTKAKAYLDVGKPIEFETDFNFLPEISRTEFLIDEALSNIEKQEQKVVNAFFWFSNLSDADAIALEHLTAGNIKKAADIWNKLAKQVAVNARKVSAINNLGTLRYVFALNYFEAKDKMIKSSVRLKNKLLNRDNFKVFIECIGNEQTALLDEILNTVTEKFFIELKEDLFKSKALSADKTGELIATLPNYLKKQAEDIFIGNEVSIIEGAVYKAKQEREKHVSKANEVGKTLYSRISEPLEKIRKLLGDRHLTYKMLADKVALELIDCSIGYYNHHSKGMEVDPGDDALILFDRAEKLAKGGSVKKRLSDNKPTIKEWVANKSERERLKRVKTEMDYIYGILDSHARQLPSISLAKDIFQKCRPKLRIIEDKFGSENKDYINISSTIVNVVQGILVEHINIEQEKLTNPINNTAENINRLNRSASEAISLFNQMKGLAKNHELRKRFNDNLSALKNLESNTGSSSHSGGDCFIATMAYGDYDHPQVLELRKFRDQVLLKSTFGKIFVKIYYWGSPKLVALLGNKPKLNHKIRTVLDYLIKIIR